MHELLIVKLHHHKDEEIALNAKLENFAVAIVL